MNHPGRVLHIYEQDDIDMKVALCGRMRWRTSRREESPNGEIFLGAHTVMAYHLCGDKVHTVCEECINHEDIELLVLGSVGTEFG